MTTSVLVAIAPSSALAEPTVSSIEKQIDAANNKLEPIIEDYNRVHSLLAGNQAKVAGLTAKLRPLELQSSIAMQRVQPIITQMYMAGPNLTARLLLQNGSTDSLLNNLTLLGVIAHNQQAQIASLLAARDKYRATKRQLDAAAATLSKQNTQLAAQKKTIQAQLDALQKLRQKVYGSSGGPVGTLRPVVCPFTYIGGAAGVAVRTACSQIGKPYVWAADGPSSFDCSGLTLYAWAKAGKTLRHYTQWQWEDTTPISRSQLQPGDLVFFYPPSLHHVGIYVGGGWMVHAPHTGDYVRMARIDSYPIGGYRRP
jgi:cell wall-associated NlpC family hydrolase